MNKEIVLLIQQGFSILTPTMRLSRYLKNQYAGLQLESGKNVWESPEILPWHAWLYSYWDDLAASGEIELLRLAAWQQQTLWLQIIQKSDYARDILQPQNVARKAVQAWELSHQWEIPLFPKDIFISHDVRAFQSWAHSYQQLCQAEKWIDDACLADVLITKLSGNSKSLKQKIALIGFESIHPQQRSLLRKLSDTGSEVKEVEFETLNRKIVGADFDDVRDEIDAVANWVRYLLQSSENSNIGIVVPKLQKLRGQIQTQFDDVFLADDILRAADNSGKPYSISLGQGLNNYPLIDTAFSILALVEQPFSIQEFGVLLRSPFVRGATEEKAGRALLDASLREFGEQHLSISTLNYIVENYLEKEQSEVFLQCLLQWQAAFEVLPARQSAQNWAQAFSTLLSIFKWPGDRTLSSAEYQTMQAWQDLLVRFVSLDIVNSSLSYRAALSQLRQLASAFSFQPETAEVPVQVMGMAGAAGMHFDHLWIMGLHEDAWPGPAEPNPFIPLVLQRQHQLPFGSAESHLSHSRHITDCLINSSADVVISYPQNEQENVQRPSPLIKSYFKDTEKYQLERLTSFRKLIFSSASIEFIQDEVAPAIKSGQRVSGGTGLFKDQAACAYRAFSRHRLHALSLSRADIGLDAMQRGSLLHDVMQIFWTKVSSQSSLLEMTEAEEKKVIISSIDAVLASYQKQRPLTFTDRFVLLERQRLLGLILEWLIIEKQRQTFSVKACEAKHNFIFDDIEVHTRIDRIDELDDGRQVIIDYKTGAVSLNAWFDERPDDPQLPLYAITSKTDLAAIVFAKMKRGESTFIGVADEEGLFPGVKNFTDTSYTDEFENWIGLMTSWNEIMTRIAHDFRIGRAEVNPKNANTCRYCDLHAFCRVYEVADDNSLPGRDYE
jgi:ATP-dependent helicase/nuclease subunit B